MKSGVARRCSEGAGAERGKRTEGRHLPRAAPFRAPRGKRPCRNDGSGVLARILGEAGILSFRRLHTTSAQLVQIVIRVPFPATPAGCQRVVCIRCVRRPAKLKTAMATTDKVCRPRRRRSCSCLLTRSHRLARHRPHCRCDFRTPRSSRHSRRLRRDSVRMGGLRDDWALPEDPSGLEVSLWLQRRCEGRCVCATCGAAAAVASVGRRRCSRRCGPAPSLTRPLPLFRSLQHPLYVTSSHCIGAKPPGDTEVRLPAAASRWRGTHTGFTLRFRSLIRRFPTPAALEVARQCVTLARTLARRSTIRAPLSRALTGLL